MVLSGLLNQQQQQQSECETQQGSKAKKWGSASAAGEIIDRCDTPSRLRPELHQRGQHRDEVISWVKGSVCFALKFAFPPL